MEKMAYFDNAATTFPKPECVYDFTDQFYRECGVNVGRGQHKLASRASALVQETRELLLELFHCPAKKRCSHSYCNRGNQPHSKRIAY